MKLMNTSRSEFWERFTCFFVYKRKTFIDRVYKNLRKNKLLNTFKKNNIPMRYRFKTSKSARDFNCL